MKSVAAESMQSSGIVAQGVQTWLTQFPRDAYVNAVELGCLLRRCKRTIERMWRRGELPFPLKLGGRNVWMMGCIVDHFQMRQAAALKVGGKAGK